MKVLFVISGVWFLHWLCLFPSRLLDLIAASESHPSLLSGTFPNILGIATSSLSIS